MGRWLSVVSLVALASCHAVWGLYGDPPADASGDAADEGVDDGPDDTLSDGGCQMMMCLDTHDEDLDCAPDFCDLCPHLPAPEPTMDTDGDGAGNACDVAPGTPGPRAFSSFVAGDDFAPFMSTAWFVDGDALHGATAVGGAFAYHDQQSRPPSIISTRVSITLGGAMTYQGLAFSMSSNTDTPSTGYVAVVSRKSSGLVLGIYDVSQGVVASLGLELPLESGGPLFDLSVEASTSATFVRIRDVSNNVDYPQQEVDAVPNANGHDGVVVGPGANAHFEYWFRSTTFSP